MAFPRGPARAPAPARVRAAVFAVGRRVYIAAGADDRPTRVTLTDDAERPRGNLSEGDEVTVLAWRPGSADTTRYCVRVTDSGLEGWVPAAALRSTKAPIPSSSLAPVPANARCAAPRAPDGDTRGRRFGERSS